MTPDELRNRCVDVMYELKEMVISEEVSNEYLYDLRLLKLESLCREMIAVGLERACAYYSNQIHHDMDDYPDKFVKWCRQEAQRVKKDVWITEKAAQEDGCRVDAGRIEECQRELGS